jgi:hypothetical protein
VKQAIAIKQTSAAMDVVLTAIYTLMGIGPAIIINALAAALHAMLATALTVTKIIAAPSAAQARPKQKIVEAALAESNLTAVPVACGIALPAI